MFLTKEIVTEKQIGLESDSLVVIGVCVAVTLLVILIIIVVTIIMVKKYVLVPVLFFRLLENMARLNQQACYSSDTQSKARPGGQACTQIALTFFILLEIRIIDCFNQVNML